MQTSRPVRKLLSENTVTSRCREIIFGAAKLKKDEAPAAQIERRRTWAPLHRGVTPPSVRRSEI